MKQIIVKNIDYQDFKGVKQFKTSLQVGRNKVSGYNGSGKTTLAEAIIFSLTGKGLFDERIKNEPIKNGEIKKDYNQIIELVLSVDEVDYKITRNIVNNSLKGMTINDKPFKTLKDFNVEIENILGLKMEEIPLLSNPKYFNTLSNKEARQSIISFVEKDIDETNYTTDVNSITNINRGINLTTQLEILEKDIKTSKEELDGVDIRIKSKKESRESISNVDFEEKDELLAKKEEVQKEISAFKSLRIINNLNQGNKMKLKNEINLLQDKKAKVDALRGELTDEIKSIDSLLDVCRRNFDEVNLKPIDETCSICGSITEHVKELGEKHKKDALDEINQKANKLKSEQDDKFKQIEEIEKRGKSFETKYKQLKIKLDSFDPVETYNDEELVKKENELTTIIESLGSYDAIKIIDNEIIKVEEQRKSIKLKLDSLNENHIRLSEFLKEKANYIEEVINSQLESIKIKLFEVKKNGNIKDIFTITNLDGIDFSRLNNAAQINAGIELINFVQKQKGIKFPVIVDNAESVNKLFKTTSQTLELYVSDGNMEIK